MLNQLWNFSMHFYRFYSRKSLSLFNTLCGSKYIFRTMLFSTPYMGMNKSFLRLIQPQESAIKWAQLSISYFIYTDFTPLTMSIWHEISRQSTIFMETHFWFIAKPSIWVIFKFAGKSSNSFATYANCSDEKWREDGKRQRNSLWDAKEFTKSSKMI